MSQKEQNELFPECMEQKPKNYNGLSIAPYLTVNCELLKFFPLKTLERLLHPG
jgi:hypothetical protein